MPPWSISKRQLEKSKEVVCQARVHQVAQWV